MGLTQIPWTPEKDEHLRHLLAEGKTAGEAADIMPGRTFAAVKCRIRLLGLKALRPRPDAWTPEEDERLRQLWCVEGLSAGKIAKLMPERGKLNAIVGRVHRLGMSSASRAKNTRAQQHSASKPAVERRAKPMLRFGGHSIPKSVIPIEMPAPKQPASGMTLLERAPHQCGWPVNDGNPYRYCGATKTGHKHYCDRHAGAGAARRRAT